MKHYYAIRSCMLGILLLAAFAVNAQTGVVTGTVLDETNQPLPGASVKINETSQGTVTDAAGNFRFTGVRSGQITVSVFFIGYTPAAQTVSLTDRVALSYKLNVDRQSLNEVVVIGYGTAQKKDLTGSVTTVSAKDFQTGAITTPEQLIAGKVAGVQITSNGGAPGSGSAIRIRGGASLNASNEPLIVIDGVPMAPSRKSDGSSSIAGSPDPLSLINPNDIESFTVLKDASSTAIYGNRGSNGVIIITTKKGKSGKPVFAFTTLGSYGTIARKADIMTTDEFKALVSGATLPIATPALKALAGTASTDWQNEIYQGTFSTDNNFSVGGSAKNLPYRLSLGYLNQDGILRTGNLKRTSLGLNLSPTLFNNNLRLNINLKGSYGKSRFADQGAIGTAARFDPTKPVFSGNTKYGGYWEWLDASATSGLRSLAPRNPLGMLEQKDDKSNVYRSIGNIQFDYALPFLKELRANLNLGYDVSRGTGQILVTDMAAGSFQRFIDAGGAARSGQNTEYKQEKTNLVSDFYLNYNKALTSIRSTIDITGGTSYQMFRSNEYSFADFSRDGVKRPNSDPNFLVDKPENRLLSYYGRAIYNLNEKYILTGTVRADGSSRLAKNNRWGVFPSAAFAWRISQEGFMKNSKSISDLKLRVGYGITGQQEGISNYSYLGNYALSNNTAQYELGGVFYNLYRPSAYNPNLKWEETSTINAGIDYGFAGNRISGSVDYYKKKTKDLLNVITQPAGTNFINEFIDNVGNMENEGVELVLTTAAVSRPGFKLDLGFNATYNKNRITNLTSVVDPSFIGNRIGGISGGTGNNIQINSTGYNRASFYVYQQVYDQNGKPLDDVFVDRNGDGEISDKDLYRYKDADADVYLGFTTNVSFKKWSGGFVLRSNINNYVYNNVASSTGTYRNIFNPLNYLNNGSADILNTGFSGAGDRYFLSDYYVKNASFLRMDNINLGYNFGPVINQKANLRMSLNAQNVFVITKYDGVDPEINGGIDNNFYPRPRIFALGLNLDF
ncbi:MAG: SusC/RagA family TonB-linked outer membrane protein [Daejeonella sp.]